MLIKVLRHKRRVQGLYIGLMLALSGIANAEHAKFDPVSGALQIPVVEVPNGGEVECYQASFALLPSSATLAFSLENAQQVNCVEDNGFISFNHQQTLTLTGTWSFTNSGEPKKYRLTDTKEDPEKPGEYFIVGIEEFSNNKVIAGYSPEFKDFSLLETGSELNYFYTFTLGADGNVTGCYYEYKTNADFDKCLDFTGVRADSKLSKQSKERSIQWLDKLSKLP